MVSEDVPDRMLGGLGKHAVTLANALTALGHSVDFLGNNTVPFATTIDEVGFQGRFLAGLNMKHIHWKEVQLGFFNYYRRAFMGWQFASAIKRVADNYDVIHYHGHIPLVANYIPRDGNFVQTRHDQGSDCLTHVRFKNGRVCVEVSPEACASCATTHPDRIQTRLSAASVRRFRQETANAFVRHKVIFVSDFLRRSFERTGGSLAASPSHVIHNFVDYQRIRRLVALATDAPARDCEVFVSARIDGPKGVAAFLERMHGSWPMTMRATVIGDGPDLAEIKERYACGNLTFLGWQRYDRVIAHLARCHVSVVPSVCEEPCATTILEALALGKPVLALRHGGTPELVRYQRYPQQLRMFDDLASLAQELRTASWRHNLSEANDFEADVMHAAERIVAVYCAPAAALAAA